MASWLVVGHGAVGSAMSRRIARAGERPAVYDPAPRVPVVGVDYFATLPPGTAAFDRVVSCVVPATASKALDAVRGVLNAATLYFDWNTLPPAEKRAIAASAPCSVLDVALMDTIDDDLASPGIAMSGPEANRAAPLLTPLGFRVEVVGAECGQAAFLKLARSYFTKTLEALVIEFEATIGLMEGRDVVIRSLEHSLGERFTAFTRMQLETNRLHADRRWKELAKAVEAVGTTAPSAQSVRLARTAIEVLRTTADVWRTPGAPAVPASAEDLAHFLAEHRKAGGGHAAG